MKGMEAPSSMKGMQLTHQEGLGFLARVNLRLGEPRSEPLRAALTEARPKNGNPLTALGQASGPELDLVQRRPQHFHHHDLSVRNSTLPPSDDAMNRRLPSRLWNNINTAVVA
eukprot:CAMPEP_0195020120 /NCGR_PEP_ID=MMETSP0326_2-20130528/34445_1 /TAXON_ID=2866 ORGANISM="Crypthecodinium cohnii, Strain Seligo" /NCGR_SAMPLE_ID=MMETSP0326_2 /ASSEMBLY_ACC=CAM_ASM_000348 /LENGTH=112 /DNA_ID=CAMNT_0040038569 /DNA_START=235 /DNA_END=570 /DNA_ORIENTATION=-